MRLSYFLLPNLHTSYLSPSLEELLSTVSICLDGLGAGRPVGRAAFSLVRVRVLKRLDGPDHLVHVPSGPIVVDDHGAHGTGGIDDEDATEGGSEHVVFGVSDQDAVVVRNLLAGVRDEGDVEGSDASIFSTGSSPAEVGVVLWEVVSE